MRFKMIWILSIALVMVLTLGAVSAAEDNATDDVIAMENPQQSEAVSLEQSSSEQVSDDSNQSIVSEKQPDDVLGACSDDVVLSSASTVTVLGASTAEPVKLTAAKTDTTKLKASKKTKYTTFKGKSKYKWKIKTSTWNKMKKQAIKQYKRFRSVGSYHPGYSNGVKVTLVRGGYKYSGIAFAVRNYKGMRCEVRCLPNGERASTWGDY